VDGDFFHGGVEERCNRRLWSHLMPGNGRKFIK
jgi:hypothetical protein